MTDEEDAQVVVPTALAGHGYIRSDSDQCTFWRFFAFAPHGLRVTTVFGEDAGTIDWDDVTYLKMNDDDDLSEPQATPAASRRMVDDEVLCFIRAPSASASTLGVENRERWLMARMWAGPDARRRRIDEFRSNVASPNR